MGSEISKNVANRKDLAETIDRCLKRDKEWTQYHAEALAESVEGSYADKGALEQAGLERRVFNLIRDGHFEKAISKLKAYCENNSHLDRRMKGVRRQLDFRFSDN